MRLIIYAFLLHLLLITLAWNNFKREHLLLFACFSVYLTPFLSRSWEHFLSFVKFWPFFSPLPIEVQTHIQGLCIKQLLGKALPWATLSQGCLWFFYFRKSNFYCKYLSFRFHWCLNIPSGSFQTELISSSHWCHFVFTSSISPSQPEEQMDSQF